MPEFPQHERLASTVGERQTIHEFSAWLIETKGLSLVGTSGARWHELSMAQIDKLAEEFMGIDQSSLAEEEDRLEVMSTDYTP
jgi:hypothetical protein